MCPGCPVCPDDHDDHDHQDDDDHVDHDFYGNHDDPLNHGDFLHLEDDEHLDHDELVTIKFVRKLEVVHKEIGSCMISYNLQLACVRKLEVL